MTTTTRRTFAKTLAAGLAAPRVGAQSSRPKNILWLKKAGAPPIEQWRSTTTQHLAVYSSDLGTSPTEPKP